MCWRMPGRKGELQRARLEDEACRDVPACFRSRRSQSSTTNASKQLMLRGGLGRSVNGDGGEEGEGEGDESWSWRTMRALMPPPTSGKVSLHTILAGIVDTGERGVGIISVRIMVSEDEDRGVRDYEL